jgi:stage II sporulation protein D
VPALIRRVPRHLRHGLAGLALLATLALPACRQAPPSVRDEAGNPPAAATPPAPTPEAPPREVAPIPPEAAVEVIDLKTGRAVFTQRADVLDRPTWMASVAKVFTLRAALDAGLVDARTRIPCRGRITLGPRTVQCVHPAFAQPLSAVEALAHSCNSFFTSLRLPPGAVASAFSGAGLPPPPASMPEPRLAWIGLDGTRVAPRRTLRAFVQLVHEALRRRSAADTLLIEGLREAARVGTASALDAAGVDALAKTGTASLGDGTYGGSVVAVSPAEAPRYAVVALGAGIAGRDAAGIAASALARVGQGANPGDASSRESSGRGVAPAHRPRQPRRVRLGRVTTGGYRVTVVDLETYVAGVVSAEATPEVGTAAREALAVAARSFAVAMRGRHERDGFDLCDLTHCQAHREPDAASTRAAVATAGEVLRRGGRVVPAYHHASCGGALEAPEVVWGGEVSMPGVMVARPDPAGASHDDGWREEVTAADLLDALRTGGHRGDELRGLSVVRRSTSGRAALLRLDGLVPAEIDGERFRTVVGRRLGWHVLKSSLYEVTRTGRGHRFDGRGRGHGVGLCVAGASRLGAQGLDRRQILSAYFTDVEVATLPASAPPTVALPATSEHERARVEGVVARRAEAVARAAGEVLPADVIVRFHDSVQAYQRATGQPWWTAGVTRGERIDLLPLDVLRRRGSLERTVGHELAHVLTAGVLDGRPRWVQEGVARHLAGERATVVTSGLACPADEEFAAAGSAAALGRLYDRALACVQRELARTGDWRTVR